MLKSAQDPDNNLVTRLGLVNFIVISPGYGGHLAACAIAGPRNMNMDNNYFIFISLHSISLDRTRESLKHGPANEPQHGMWKQVAQESDPVAFTI